MSFFVFTPSYYFITQYSEFITSVFGGAFSAILLNHQNRKNYLKQKKIMKTKSLLFAALVSISLATTSCQKEENIMPNVGYYSNDKNADKSTIIEENNGLIDGNEVSQPSSENNNPNQPKTTQPKAVTPPTNIMQIDSDEVK